MERRPGSLRALSFRASCTPASTHSRGGFREFSVTLSGDSLEGDAKVASVDVKDEQLSGHLQTPEFFDAQRYPDLTFHATRLVRNDDDTVVGEGELTIKGVTQPITFAGSISPEPATDPFGRERLGLKLETAIDRTAFGVSWNAPNQSGGDYLGNDREDHGRASRSSRPRLGQ